MFLCLLRRQNAVSGKIGLRIEARVLPKLAVSCVYEFFLCILLAACGGSNTSQPPNNPVGSTALLVNFGDLASGHIILPPGYAAEGLDVDQMAKARAEFSSIVLTRTDGSTTELLSSPVWVEFMHLQGRPEPMLTTTVPQGDYKRVAITQMAYDVTYVFPGNASPGVVSIGYCSSSSTPACPSASLSVPFTVDLSPTVHLGDSPAVLNLDLDFRIAVGVPPEGMFPYFSVNMQSIAAPSQQQAGTGAVEGLTGLISQTTTNSLELQVEGNLGSLKFTLDSNTSFDGVTEDKLATNMLVELNASTQANGELLASSVRLVGTPLQSGVIGTGLGLCNPAFGSCTTIIYGQGIPPELLKAQSYQSASPTLPEKFQLSLAGDVQFLIDSRGTSLTNLSFVPQFDANSFVNGQVVEAFGDFTPPSSFLVHSVKLRREAIAGTISQLVQSNKSNGQTTFRLTPINRGLFQTISFSLLAPNGPYDITTIQQPDTTVTGAIAEGANVRVIGLLFFDGTSNTYRMVAHSIDVVQ
jgi:hypothetical protein